MPYSSTIFDRKICDLLVEIKPKTVYDIGAGAGKYGLLLKKNFPNTYSIGIELDREYIKQFKLEKSYCEIWNIAAEDLISPRYYDFDFDTVILGDIIEHLKKSDGIDLLNFLIYRTRWILIQYPVKYIQNTVDGKSQEAHISIWGDRDFAQFEVQKKFSQKSQRLILLKGFLSKS